MDLTKEAIEKIESLVVEARKASDFEFREDSKSGTLAIRNRSEGTIQYEPLPNSVLNATVSSIAVMGDVLGFYEDKISNFETLGPTVWVSGDKAILFIDQAQLNRATLHLRLNSAFTDIQRFITLEPRELLKQMTYCLNGCDVSDGFYQSLRQVKFETTSNSESKSFKGDESIAKSVRSTVTGENVLPDEITIAFSAYPSLDIETKFAILCAVIVDPAKGVISVRPYPGELDRFMNLAVQAVAEEIAKQIGNATVFCGSVQ